MSENRAEIVITALDKATATLNRIAGKFDAISQPVGRAQAAMARFSEATGFSAVSSSISNLSGKLSGLATASVGLGVGTSVAAGGLFMFAKNAADAVDKIGDLSERYGVASKDLQVFGGLVEESGGDIDGAASAMGKLNKAMSQARAGNEAALDAFAATGIGLDDLKKKSPAEVLYKMANAFKSSEKEGAKLAVLQTLMGKTGSVMMGALNKGGPELQKRYQEMEADGSFFTKEQIAQADAFDVAWRRMSRTAEGVKNSIGLKLANALQPVVEGMQKWIVANRAFLESKIDKFVKELPEILRVLGDVFGSLWAITMKLAGAFKWLKDKIGPTNAVLAMMAPILLPIAGAVMSTVVALARFAWILGNGLVAVVPKVIGVLMRLGAFMMANPIFVAIALIGTAAYLLYANWDEVVSGVKALWEALSTKFLSDWAEISGAFAAGWAWMKGVAKVAIDGITGWFGGMYDGFIKVWDRIGSWFSAKLRNLTSMLPNWMTGGVDVNVNAVPAAAQQQAQGFAPKTAAQMIAGGAGGKTEVGGRIQIELTGVSAKVTQLSSSNKSVPIDVSAGLYGFGT